MNKDSYTGGSGQEKKAKSIPFFSS